MHSLLIHKRSVFEMSSDEIFIFYLIKTTARSSPLANCTTKNEIQVWSNMSALIANCTTLVRKYVQFEQFGSGIREYGLDILYIN